MDNIIIVQHNVLHWETRKFNLIKTYKEINPHTIVINGNGMKKTQLIRILGYITYQANTTGELHDGSEIPIKAYIKHKLGEFLDLSIESDIGEINIATTYLPPRRPYIPFQDYHRFASKNNPSYPLTDMNAFSHNIGSNSVNQDGRHLHGFITNGSLVHLGPNFPTFFSRNTQTPDIILANNKATHNITLKPIPVTLSGHIPIIVTLTSKAIIKQIPPIPNIKDTDRRRFKQKIEANLNDMTVQDNLLHEEIDSKLGQWYKIIETNMRNNIPTQTQVIDQKPITNAHIRYIQHQYRQLQQQAERTGWNIDKYNYNKVLKIKLKQETEQIKNQNLGKRHNTKSKEVQG